VASGTYAAVLALVTWQALRGQALIHPDGATLDAAAAILLAASFGTFAALRATPLPRRADESDKELVA
jgi:hypothetical protein